MLRIALSLFIVTVSGCSMQSSQHYACSWQGTGILSKYSVVATAVTTNSTIETFQLTATSATISDRSGGTCVFDLSKIPASQIDRTMTGRLRILNSRGEGEMYISVIATGNSVIIGPFGSSCSTGGMPSRVTLYPSNAKCKVEWYGR